MCGGAKYIEPSGREWKIFFPNPKAALPVVRPGRVEWVRWGRRNAEEDGSEFIVTGWARYASVEAGKWNRFHPEFVSLAVTSFMQKDLERVSHWFDIEPGKAIQALIAHANGEQRLYVITEPTPEEYSWVQHDRWPMINCLGYKYCD